MTAENRYLKALPLASLALSAASFGVGSANYANARRSQEIAREQKSTLGSQSMILHEQKKLEEKSLQALRAIHRTMESGKTT